MRNLNKDEEESYIKGLEKISTPTGYKVFEDNINYDRLLNQWVEKVFKEADIQYKIAEEEIYKNEYSKGLADGLIMATSILSNLERRIKRKIKNIKLK